MESELELLTNLLWLGGKMQVSPIRRTYGSRHYDLCIAIGNDHSATLTIDEDSLKRLCEISGHQISNFLES